MTTPELASIQGTAEYQATSRYYGTRRAKRSGVPLMHHIDEGLWILQQIGASLATQRAWCLHPIAQDAADDPGAQRLVDASSDDDDVRWLAIEYRRVANATLSTRPIEVAQDIVASARAEVSQMLVADKVQNRKDFLRYHRATHPRAKELDRYFALWLEHLGVSDDQFREWCGALEEEEDPSVAT